MRQSHCNSHGHERTGYCTHFLSFFKGTALQKQKHAGQYCEAQLAQQTERHLRAHMPCHSILQSIQAPWSVGKLITVTMDEDKVAVASGQVRWPPADSHSLSTSGQHHLKPVPSTVHRATMRKRTQQALWYAMQCCVACRSSRRTAELPSPRWPVANPQNALTLCAMCLLLPVNRAT